MLIIGCDYHPGFQQIAFVDTLTGELKEQRLAHREDAEQFRPSQRARTGGASGHGSRRALPLVRALAAGVAV